MFLRKRLLNVTSFHSKLIFIRNAAYVGEKLTPSQLSGWDILRNYRLNKGLAFTIEERQRLGIHGLLAATCRSQAQQSVIHINFLRRQWTNLLKYMYIANIRERNERLYFRLLRDYTAELLPIVSTPTVGEACQIYDMVLRPGRGLFITKYDKGNIKKVLANWPEPTIQAVVVTDGERILGLGDLGAFGMGIPIAKLSLYTALAGIKPNKLLPVCIDIGTNNEVLLKDPIYIGIREKRIRGPEYYEILDEFMEAVIDRYGRGCLIQFEDFKNKNAFDLISKYSERYCTFNDDIRGTGSAVMAGLFTCAKVIGIHLKDIKPILFYGAGGANVGIARLLVGFLATQGIPQEQVWDEIWMMDTKGLITTGRKELGVRKLPAAKDHAPTNDLLALIKEIKPLILIGASTKSKAFTPEILKTMAQNHKRPIVFALSNPTNKAECTAQEAYDNTEGKVIYASGSPMPSVNYKGKTFETGQSNNAFTFPGIALGVITFGIQRITNEIFVIAAQTVSSLVTEKDLAAGRVYPKLGNNLLDISLEIAVKIAEHAYEKNVATVYPKPKDLKDFIRSQMYSCDYSEVTVKPWPWPKMDDSHLEFDDKNDPLLQTLDTFNK